MVECKFSYNLQLIVSSYPVGSSIIAQYQKFEYAAGHWLQKTAEDVIGTVLCSPGCFTLVRYVLSVVSHA